MFILIFPNPEELHFQISMCFQHTSPSLIRKAHEEFAISHSTAWSCSDLSLPAQDITKVIWTWPCHVMGGSSSSKTVLQLSSRDETQLTSPVPGSRCGCAEHQALQHSLSRAESSVLFCPSIDGFVSASAPPAKPGQPLGPLVQLSGERPGLLMRHNEIRKSLQAPRRMSPVIPVYRDRRWRIPGTHLPHQSP